MERYTDLTREQQIDQYNQLTERHWDLLDQLAAVDTERALIMNILRNQMERKQDNAVVGVLQADEHSELRQ